MRLVLGTAQFGEAYGATNQLGRLDDAVVSELLTAAVEAGVTLFDSSPAYGDAQTRLGELAPPGVSYVSKFALPDRGGAPDHDAVIGRSLAELRVERLHGMLFHRVDDLRDGRAPAAVRLLREARDAGEVRRIGVSVYEAADLDAALAVFPDLDIVQLPGSVVDRRLLDSARVRDLHAAGVEVHVRSAYLQGVLLSAPSGLPPHLAALSPHLEHLRSVAAANGTTVLSLALRYLRDHPVVDAVLVGAVARSELATTLAAWNDPGAAPVFDAPQLAEDVIDPRRWPAKATS